MNKKDITVLIPVHDSNEEILSLLDKAFESVSDMTTKVILGKDVQENKDLLDFLTNKNIGILMNDGESDFCSQINYGANHIETEYFSILEFDDTYEKFYFNNLQQFANDRAFSSSDFYLPTVAFKDNLGKTISLANDAVWAQEFTTERGVLEEETTSLYDIFVVSGATFKTSVFKEIGGLRSDIKLYFSKELFLRAMHQGKKISVVPKLGYNHLIGRDGSLFDNIFKGGMTRHESEFYNRKTIEEYKFNPIIEDRQIIYTPPTDDQ